MRMWKHIAIAAIAVLMGAMQVASAQVDRREVRAGNRQFAKGRYRQSGIEYLKGLAKDSTSLAASYNLSSALYREKNYEEAAKTLSMGAGTADASVYSADYHFNEGDIALQKKDYKTAVEAFRKSLIVRPDDMAAKESYLYAKKKLEDQQGGQGQDDQNQDDQDDQDNKDNQNNGDNPNQDDRNRNEDENPGNDSPEDNNGEDRQNPSESKISPQQAQQMLSAIQAREKETQDKVNKEKAALLQSKQKDKNW